MFAIKSYHERRSHASYCLHAVWVSSSPLAERNAEASDGFVQIYGVILSPLMMFLQLVHKYLHIYTYCSPWCYNENAD
jgi:hypothetical protein